MIQQTSRGLLEKLLKICEQVERSLVVGCHRIKHNVILESLTLKRAETR